MRRNRYFVWREGEPDERYYCIIDHLDARGKLIVQDTLSFALGNMATFFSEKVMALPARNVKEVPSHVFLDAYKQFHARIKEILTS